MPLISLIAIAVGIPVTFFVTNCFVIANDSEALESWLEWFGWRKLVFGKNAHRKWNYTRGRPPNRHVKWFVRSIGAPQTETFTNLLLSAWAWLTRTDLPWVEEAREAAAAADAARAEDDNVDDDGKDDGSAADAASGDGSGSTSSSVAEAAETGAYKRLMAGIGLGATFLCWAIFAWCVSRSLASMHATASSDANPPRPPPGSSLCTVC